MKLSIAAGILVQTLPVVSETKISALLDPEHGRNLKLGDIIRRARAADRGGAQKQRGVKARSGRSNKKTAESSRSRVLKNVPVAPSAVTSSVDLVVCDPSSTDPDVGVLSCGSGKMCKRSQDSVLGGMCVSKKASVDRSDPRTQAAQAAKKKKRSKISDKSSSGKLTNKLQGLRTITSTSMHTSTGSNACDPLSTDADIGVLSCGEGRYCNPIKSSDLGGACADTVRTDDGPAKQPHVGFGNGGASKKAHQNKGLPTPVESECDPAAADIGILSCGPGESCVKNQDSKSGGFCVNPDPTARRLFHLTEDVGLCDPTSYDYGVYSCDCASFDNTTKTGTIACVTTADECFGSKFYGCYETCGTSSSTYDFESNSFTSVKYCYEFSTPTTESLCVTYSDGFATCATEYNGQSCISCQILDSYDVSFDCSNAGGPSSAGGKVLKASNSIGACYQPVPEAENCDVCGYSSYIPFANNDIPVFLQGFGDTTCYGLTVASTYSQISTEKCPEASAVAQSSCCALYCGICGFNTIIPSGSSGNPVTVPGLGETTCGELSYAAYQNFSLPEGSCPAVSEAAADACCESFCELCSSSFIPSSKYGIPISVPGFEDITTCGELDRAAYVDVTITGESCSVFAEIAESTW
jgi:hypothetical protein